MKILIVSQHFYPEQFRINDIAQELVKLGHKVTVLTGLPNYPGGKIYRGYHFRNHNEVKNGVIIKRTYIIGRGKNIISMGINYLLFAINGMIKALFMKKDFDIVYVYQTSPVSMAWPGIVVSRIKKIPIIIHILDQWPISIASGGFNKKSLFYKIIYMLSKETYKKANVLTISSKGFKEYIINELKINNIPIIYHPSYAEDIYQKALCFDNNIFDLLYAGNIGPATSVETIVECANILKNNKDIMFHIVGGGLSKASCVKLCQKYNLKNVKFYNQRTVDEMKEFYELADAFLITMDDNEVVNNTLPAKLQSYISAGKAIFGAVSGEAKQTIIEAKCGIVCDSLDYRALANLITQNYKNNKVLKEYGSNGYNFYKKHFEKEKCLKALNKLMNDLINNNVR